MSIEWRHNSIGPCTLSPKFPYAFFLFFLHIRHPFLLKWLWMQKTQQIEPDLNFFYDEWKFWRQCVNMIDNVSSYWFFTMRTIRTKILYSVCNDVNAPWCFKIAYHMHYTKTYSILWTKASDVKTHKSQACRFSLFFNLLLTVADF